MLIKKIRLVNFKNFEDVTVELNDFNVLVGANASGKTNFIEAIRFLKEILLSGFESAVQLQGGLEYLRNTLIKGDKNTKLSFEIHIATNIVFKVIEPNHELFFHNYKVIYELEISTINENLSIDSELFTYESILKEKYKDFEKEQRKIKSFVLRKGRDWKFSNDVDSESIRILLSNNYEYEISKKEATPIASIEHILPESFSSNETMIESFGIGLLFSPNILQFYDFDLKKAKQPTTITGKAELEENAENLSIVLKKISADPKKYNEFINLLKYSLEFIDNVEIKKYDKNLFLSINEVYNLGTPMPSSLLSDGTISITAMIVSLFFETKQMAIFEEPEKGIHPALISKLVNLFYDASRNKQIFITTHNPEILKYTKLNDLLLISRNERGFSEISRPAENQMVKSFLANELGIDQLFTQNLLEV